MHGERGQVIILWIFGVLAVICLTGATISLGDQMRWQIRAQNAADSAAYAQLAVQVQEYNRMNVLLYAASIEEFRIRKLQSGMALAARNNGSCTAWPNHQYDTTIFTTTPNAGNSCMEFFFQLRPKLAQAVNRFTTLTNLVNRATASENFTTQKADGARLIGLLGTPKACASSVHLDCAFAYTTLDFTARPRSDMQPIAMANAGIRHGIGGSTNPGLIDNPLNENVFGPAMTDVVVCRSYMTLYDRFLGRPPIRIVARGAAKNAVTQAEWWQPAFYTNPWTKAPFAPAEPYVSPQGPDNQDWYEPSPSGFTYQASPADPGISQRFGESASSNVQFMDELEYDNFWWGTTPVAPFAGIIDPAAIACK